MGGEQNETPPVTKTGLLKKIETIAKTWQAILGFIVFLAATGYGLYEWLRDRQPDSPARVTVRLTTCEQYRLVMETVNSGGQSAVVGRPVFSVSSARRPQPPPPLRMLSFMDEEPPDPGIVAPAGRVLRPYELSRPLFGRDEAAHGCHVRVRVPVSPDEGTHAEATAECPCVYR